MNTSFSELKFTILWDDCLVVAMKMIGMADGVDRPMAVPIPDEAELPFPKRRARLQVTSGSFKLSGGPAFGGRIRDIVGLPPLTAGPGTDALR